MRVTSLLIASSILTLAACAGDDDPAADEKKIDPDAVRAMGPAVDPMCTDGEYAEVPPKLEPIDDLIESYDPNNALDFVREVLRRRYPVGLYIFDGGMASEGDESCFDQFLPEEDRGDVNDVLYAIDTLVHECGHFFDTGMSDYGSNSYFITPDISFTCRGGDAEGRGGVTFARSLINQDEFAQQRPPCFTVQDGDESCDGYGDVYLDGDPYDDNFDSGDQGYNMLLEEAVQYINSLGAAFVVSDKTQYNVSARDGLLTYVWYLARYLRMARLQYPEAYAHLSTDPCWREATLTVWGRAWMYLEGTDGNGKLELDARAIEPLAMAPELFEEMAIYRGTCQ